MARLRTVAVVAVVATVVVLVTAACGSKSAGTQSGAATAGVAATGGFNDQDASFASNMIIHHRQAVDMAALAAERAASPEVKDLANNIEAAQDPEIAMMGGWLDGWGQAMPEDMSGHDMGGAMPGMMSQADLDQLSSARGEEFDRLFLTMMIAHHEGAIAMAAQQRQSGRNSEATELADKITADQTAEIERMRGLLQPMGS